MAQEPQYNFHCYQRVELFKTESLGSGLYGAVCKAMCDDLPCAAKILHPALQQFTVPGTTVNLLQRFEQECRLLSAIKHPHIVQYLGTHQDPESRLPMLLMELMDESLTRFLQRSHEPLPYHTEVNLCHDIAMALSYLHSHGIIHRDLSSNNVLLIAGSRVKVMDFGMVKLFDSSVNHSIAHHNTAHLTLCRGTVSYMPPEALRDRPVYTDKLDSFSFGVLCIQIMTRQLPNPGDRVTIIGDPQFPNKRIELSVSEIQRRQSHISLITQTHPLLQIALNCLQDEGEKRPPAQELCQGIAQLKTGTLYYYSVQQLQVSNIQSPSGDPERRIRDLQQQLAQQAQSTQTFQLQLNVQSDKLRGKEHEIQQQHQQMLRQQNILTATNDRLQTLKQKLTTKDEQLASKDHQLQQKEAVIAACQQGIQQLRQQLQSSEQVIAEFQRNLLEKEKNIQDQRKQIQELQQQLRERQEELEASGVTASWGSIKLRWRDGGRAPRKMWGKVAAVKGSVAYFRSDQEVYSYDSSSKKWSEFPECPNHGFSLAIVNGLLTTIGGKTPNEQVTNSLLSFTGSKWREQFPPMPTKRWLTATVCNGWYLAVAGGVGERGNSLKTVEMMDTQTLQWSTASSLPHSLYSTSATLCGDQVHILGGRDWNHTPSKSVFTCSLVSLLQSRQPQSLVAGISNLELASRPRVWRQLADTPYYRSTCASLQGQLLAVGGCNSDDKEKTAIHMYNTTTNSWEVISHMTTPRYRCLVAVLPHDKLMVVGGCTFGDTIDSVEIATNV